jgi:hypothetical protein
LSLPTSKQRPWRRRTSSPGRNVTPTGSNARRIGPATAGRGARRSASKSSIALALTEAADASFATDQPSRARAERHWAAEIIALGRAGKVRKRAIAITASVSRHPHNRSRLDRISSAICLSTNKGVVKPGYAPCRACWEGRQSDFGDLIGPIPKARRYRRYGRRERLEKIPLPMSTPTATTPTRTAPSSKNSPAEARIPISSTWRNHAYFLA